jgi:hypothetical protein
MNKMKSLNLGKGPCGMALVLVLGLNGRAIAAELKTASNTASASASAVVTSDDDSGPKNKDRRIVIERIEPGSESGKVVKREVGWLGIGTEEASETLATQLGLRRGEGLVITYVAPDSPAAKAGLQKHDVLVKMDKQLTIYPAQLRKLVQMHKDGDPVDLEFYRSGQKQDLTVTLGKTTTVAGLPRDERGPEGELGELQRQLRSLPNSEALRREMQALHESLANSGLDKEALRIEIRKSIEEARRAAETALRQAGNQFDGTSAHLKILEDLAKSGVDIDRDATVTVKSHDHSVQTQVKTDDNGTYVIVANPKKRLTAHDNKGKLLFDGEIETPEQQKKVPKDVWSEVEPMLKQMENPKAEKDDADDK